jgi:hypothetical protein
VACELTRGYHAKERESVRPIFSGDCTNMRLFALQALSIAAVVVGLAGCQSGPRWAWWKPKDASEDKSLLARAADPALPSAQSTPQVAESGGLQPVAPPSSANLAVAGTPAKAAAAPLPSGSSATVANAPLANYPIVTPAAENSISALGSAPIAPAPSGTRPATSIIPSSLPQVAATTAPTTKPYDPNGYQPVSPAPTAPTAGQALTSVDRYATSAADRYGMTATAPPSTPTPLDASPNFAPASSPIGAAMNDDQFGPTPEDRYSSSPVTTSLAPAVPQAAQPSPVASASVPAGQYRPGGTSSYTSGTASEHLEVASRPAATTTPGASSPTPEGSEASVPWTPPGTSPPESNSGIGTY